MNRVARHLLFLSVILWIVTLLSAVAQPAWAEISGNCEATFKGVNVRPLSSTSAGDAIDVDENEVVGVNFTSPVGFASHKIDLEIAGVSRTVSSKTDDGDSQWSGSVNVKDYAWVGAGLYKVTGSAVLTDGSTCSGAALINVTRNPLTTVAGGAAAASTAVGGAGLLASSAASGLEGIRAGRKVEDWIMDEVQKASEPPAGEPSEERRRDIERGYRAIVGVGGMAMMGYCLPFVLPALLLTGAAMVGGGGAPSQPTGLRLGRVSWRPRIAGAGLLGGLLAGAGIVVLLQQYAVAPLTRSLAIEGLVIGLVLGIVLPSLVRVWSVIRVNGVIARGERRLNEALAQAGPPPPPPGGPQTPPEGGP